MLNLHNYLLKININLVEGVHNLLIKIHILQLTFFFSLFRLELFGFLINQFLLQKDQVLLDLWKLRFGHYLLRLNLILNVWPRDLIWVKGVAFTFTFPTQCRLFLEIRLLLNIWLVLLIKELLLYLLLNLAHLVPNKLHSSHLFSTILLNCLIFRRVSQCHCILFFFWVIFIIIG